MLLPVVGCPNVFTNDDVNDDDEEASFLPSSSSSFGFFLVEGALSSGWSENIGRLCCDGDSIEGVVVVVVVVDASSSTYEFTGTIGKKKEDAPPPSPPPLRVVVAPLIIVSLWAIWVQSLSSKSARRVKSEGEFSFISPHILCAHFVHARTHIGISAFLRRAPPPRRDFVAKDNTETTEKAFARNIHTRGGEKPRRRRRFFRCWWCEAEKIGPKSFEYSRNIIIITVKEGICDGIY